MRPAGSLSLKQSLIKPRRALLKYTVHTNSTHLSKPRQFQWWIKEARLHNTWPAGKQRLGLCMLIGFASGPAALCSRWRQLSIRGWVMEAQIEMNYVCVCVGGINAVSITDLCKKHKLKQYFSVNKMQFPNDCDSAECCFSCLLHVRSRRLVTSAQAKPVHVKRAWPYSIDTYRRLQDDLLRFWWLMHNWKFPPSKKRLFKVYLFSLFFFCFLKEKKNTFVGKSRL